MSSIFTQVPSKHRQIHTHPKPGPPPQKKRKNNHCFPLFLQSFIVSKVLCWKLAGISEKGLPLITAWSTSGNLAWQPQTTTFLTSLTLEQFPCSHVAGTTIQNETSQQTLEVVGMWHEMTYMLHESAWLTCLISWKLPLAFWHCRLNPFNPPHLTFQPHVTPQNIITKSKHKIKSAQCLVGESGWFTNYIL